MQFDVLTLFPGAIEPYLESSILGRAQKSELITTRLWDIRNYSTDKHKTVDDTPYGGGAGMVMKIEPVDRALTAATQDTNTSTKRVVVLSARGQQFTQTKAKEYAALDQLILICGRYEGVDHRIVEHLADEELSVGPYVLAGGEIAALVVIEATARLIPGVLGNEESLTEESHTEPGVIEAPQYTKPEEYKGWRVPEVLLSGNHQAIKQWRKEDSGSLK
ncbi:MAG: tRNA (guanosine(37)-N1)-methyltransferase TrmD [Candidatus Andersenbacteria bacterium]